MSKTWVKWCVDHNMKFVLYIIWLLILPLFLLAYLENAAEDAMYELNWIKNLKKGNL